MAADEFHVRGTERGDTSSEVAATPQYIHIDFLAGAFLYACRVHVIRHAFISSALYLFSSADTQMLDALSSAASQSARRYRHESLFI